MNQQRERNWQHSSVRILKLQAWQEVWHSPLTIILLIATHNGIKCWTDNMDGFHLIPCWQPDTVLSSSGVVLNSKPSYKSQQVAAEDFICQNSRTSLWVYSSYLFKRVTITSLKDIVSWKQQLLQLCVWQLLELSFNMGVPAL